MIWTIYRKEMLDVLRDRRTLIFMLFLPIIIIPAIMGAMTKLTEAVARKQAVETVSVAASEDDAAVYRRFVHNWFLRQPYANEIRLTASPLMLALAKKAGGPKEGTETGAALGEALGKIPPEIFTSPDAFAGWTRLIATTAMEKAGEVRENQKPSPEALENVLKMLSPQQREAGMTFYNVAIKGLGLIEFVDPPEAFEPETGADEIPETIKTAAAQAIRAKKIDAWLILPPDFETKLGEDMGQTSAAILHDSTIGLSNEASNRLSMSIRTGGRSVVVAKLAGRGLGSEFLTPVELEAGADLAPPSRRIMNLVGGLLPYLIIAFGFMGGMFPAIDLGAGEKERQTLETILLAPVSRTSIAIGKFLVIFTTSLVTALMGVLALTIAARQFAPKALIDMFEGGISPATAAQAALLAIPAAAAFGGLLLAVSIFARSFKEAQSYIGPLNLLVVLPAMAGLIPGLELNWKLALIPIVNLSMISRDLLKGDLNWGYYGLTLASCGLMAVVGIMLAVKMFNREEVLFRS